MLTVTSGLDFFEISWLLVGFGFGSSDGLQVLVARCDSECGLLGATPSVVTVTNGDCVYNLVNRCIGNRINRMCALGD